jgi:hypothetical protein
MKIKKKPVQKIGFFSFTRFLKQRVTGLSRSPVFSDHNLDTDFRSICSSILDRHLYKWFQKNLRNSWIIPCQYVQNQEWDAKPYDELSPLMGEMASGFRKAIILLIECMYFWVFSGHHFQRMILFYL